MIVGVQIDPIDAPGLLAALTTDGAGAVVSFTGLVRADPGVEALQLEAYPGFTEVRIGEEAATVFSACDLIDLAAVHRIGRIAPGETVVFVAAAARYRRAAFEACDRLMDYLKTAAPFWKAEHTTDGLRWIEPTAADHADAARWLHEETG